MTRVKNMEQPVGKGPSVRFYDLDKLRFVIKDATGLDVAYAYEDLVFSEDAVFIVQFGAEKQDTFNCFFNRDCIEANRIAMLASLNATAELNGAIIDYKGKFELVIKEGAESFDIKLC